MTPVTYIDKAPTSTMTKSKKKKKGGISKIDISGPASGSFIHVTGMTVDKTGDMKKVDNSHKLDPVLRKLLVIAGVDETNMTAEDVKVAQEFAKNENIYEVYEQKRMTMQVKPPRRPKGDKPVASTPQVPHRPPPPNVPPPRSQRPQASVPPPPPGSPPKKSGGGGPPPPPPPPGPGPPPPPPVSTIPPKPGASLKPKMDLNSQIANFSSDKLKKFDPNDNPKPAPTDGRSALMAAIVAGKQLKKVEDRKIDEKPLPPSSGGGLQGALADALGHFKAANFGSDDEDKSSEESEWSDDD